MSCPRDGAAIDGRRARPSACARRGPLTSARKPPWGPAHPVAIRALQLASVELLAAAAGVPLDPARGHVAVAVSDCGNVAASGVTVHASTADSSSTRFYLAGGIPSPAATETEAPEPFGGYLNLPPRLVTMEARVAALDQSLGTLPLIVRPGTLTIAGMLPMP